MYNNTVCQTKFMRCKLEEVKRTLPAAAKTYLIFKPEKLDCDLVSSGTLLVLKVKFSTAFT